MTFPPEGLRGVGFIALASSVLVILNSAFMKGALPQKKGILMTMSESKKQPLHPSWLDVGETAKPANDSEDEVMIELALGRWQEIGISRSNVEASLLLDDPYADQPNGCFGVQFVSSPPKLFTWGRLPSEHPDPGIRELLRSRRKHILLSLQEVILSGRFRINSFEAIFCLGDCVMSQMRFHPLSFPHESGYVLPGDPLPIFAVVKCTGSMNIPFPIWDIATGELDSWERTKQAIISASEAEPWNERHRQAVFRGATRTCTLYPTIGKRTEGLRMYSPKADDLENASKCGRTGMMYQCLTSRVSHLFNVSVFGFQWMDMPRDYDQPAWLSLQDQTKFRYVIYAEGHCQWANRLRHLLFLGAVILFQDTECIEHYGLLLEPWKHYIPVDYWFSNITEAIEWGESHPEETRLIVKRLRTYAEKYLSRISVMEYTGKLIERYSTLMLYTPETREDGVEVNETCVQ